jgi:hypothetical protein
MRREHPVWFREDPSDLFAMLADGRIKPVVAEVLSRKGCIAPANASRPERSRASCPGRLRTLKPVAFRAGAFVPGAQTIVGPTA